MRRRDPDLREAPDPECCGKQELLNPLGEEDAADGDPDEECRPRGFCAQQAVHGVHWAPQMAFFDSGRSSRWGRYIRMTTLDTRTTAGPCTPGAAPNCSRPC